jgi:hypothetical protein
MELFLFGRSKKANLDQVVATTNDVYRKRPMRCSYTLRLSGDGQLHRWSCHIQRQQVYRISALDGEGWSAISPFRLPHLTHASVMRRGLLVSLRSNGRTPVMAARAGNQNRLFC